MENQDRKTAPLSSLYFISGGLREREYDRPRAHLKETLHQDPYVKSENLFLEKCPPFKKISGHK